LATQVGCADNGTVQRQTAIASTSAAREACVLRRIHDRNLVAKHGVAMFQAATFGGLFRLCLLAMGRSVLSSCLLRSTTFAVTGCAVPNVENHFPGQAEVVHCRPQQHVTASPLAFCSERLALLFNQREHFAIRRMAGGRQYPRSTRWLIERRRPTAPAVIGSYRQIRPEPACVKVEGSITETYPAAMVTKAEVTAATDRP
jgi:hypothetical protein